MQNSTGSFDFTKGAQNCSAGDDLNMCQSAHEAVLNKSTIGSRAVWYSRALPSKSRASVRSLRSTDSPAKVCCRTNLRKMGYRLLALKWLVRSSFSSCSRTATLSASLEGCHVSVTWSANIAFRHYAFRVRIVLQIDQRRRF